jgi:hypothetical protein
VRAKNAPELAGSLLLLEPAGRIARLVVLMRMRQLFSKRLHILHVPPRFRN